MFNWILTTKKKDSDESFSPPSPPKPDWELVKVLKNKPYYSFFFDPDLFEEMIDEANDRIHKQQLIRELDYLIEDLDNQIVSNVSSESDSDSEEEYITKETAREILNKILSENLDESSDLPESSSEEDEIVDQRDCLRSAVTEDINEQIKHANKRARSGSLDTCIEAFNKEHKIETFDWDTKLKEWGVDYDYSFPNYEELESGVRQNIPVEELNEIVVENPITEEDIKSISEKIGEWCVDSEEFETNPVYEPSPKRFIKHAPRRESPEGFLELFIGPMKASKSSKILFKLSSMADQRFKCLYVNSIKDVRNTEVADATVTTHNSAYCKLSDKITQIKVKSLSEIDVSDYDYIGVDLQFFDDKDTVDTIKHWVDIEGKYVSIASLDGDCYRRKFGVVLDLIPHADQVTKLTAFCDICRDNYRLLKPAPFTARMTNDTTAELIGGYEIYKSLCRECHQFHLDVTVNTL